DGGLAGLPAGARIGTASPRRRAQLLAHRPDLVVVLLRGNVDTRLRKWRAGEVDALLLAAAGLARLGISEPAAQPLPVDEFLPAVGQGALALECRADDGATRALLAAVDRPAAATPVAAADVVVHDDLVSRRLLEHTRPAAEIVAVGGAHGDPARLGQDAIEALLVARAQTGKTVVRLKNGDPFLFGRGAEEAEALRRAG